MDSHPLAIIGQTQHLRPEDVKAAVLKALKMGLDVAKDERFQSAFDQLFEQFKLRSSRYSPNTLQRLESAWRMFVTWCQDTKSHALPASPETVELYFIYRSDTLHRNTISLDRWAIARVHRIAGCPNPCTDVYVDDRLKAIRRDKAQKGEVIKQAAPFNERHLDRLTELWRSSPSLLLRRNLAMLSVAYESMLRAAELTRIQLKDIEVMEDGSAVLTVPITKTNHSGEPDTKFLSPEVVDIVRQYLTLADLHWQDDGYLFVGITKHNTRFKVKRDRDQQFVHRPITPKSVEGVFYKGWEVLGEEGKPFTAHSARVGATQDLLRKGYDVLQVQQSGGWSSPAMVARYGRAILARDGAMARSRQRNTHQSR